MILFSFFSFEAQYSQPSAKLLHGQPEIYVCTIVLASVKLSENMREGCYDVNGWLILRRTPQKVAKG